VDEQISMAFYLAAVCLVEMDSMGIESKCGEAEKKGWWRSECDAEVRFARS
jgi:hypothetical protein